MPNRPTPLVAALIQDRFAPGAERDRLAADSRVGPLAESLLRFPRGRVAPEAGAMDVDGLPVAPARVDRELLALAGGAAPRRWPGGARAAVIVTHDVDLFDGLSFFPVRVAGWGYLALRALARRDVGRAAQLGRRAATWVGWWRRGEDPVADLDAWMALEAEHGVRSTFFFLALPRALSREGRLYRVDDPRVRRALHALHAGGWEVGLHASRYGSAHAAGLVEQRHRLEDALGAPVRSVRFHYLTGEFPAAWRHMAEAGFEISSNVGFHAPYQGFRTGTAWPYRPLAATGDRLREFPMALMDAASGPGAARLEAVFERLMAETLEVGGALVINFHPNYRAEVDAPGVHRQFRAILGRVRAAVARGEVAALTLAAATDHVDAAP